MTDEELYQTLSLAKNSASSSPPIAKMPISSRSCRRSCSPKARPDRNGITGSRPPLVEAEGVHHLMTFAEMTGAHVYIVHQAARKRSREAIAARQRGVKVVGRDADPISCSLDQDLRRAAEFRRREVCHVAAAARQEKPGGALERPAPGLFSTLATDHAPFDFATQKTDGRDDFTKIPNGIPSLEDRVNLLYTHGVKRAGSTCISLSTAASTQAAKTLRTLPAQRARSSSAATPTSWSTIRIIAARFPPRRTR